jgi:hypothetical protein
MGEKTDDNFTRFNNKKQITCVFTFDNNSKPYYINWFDNENNNIIETQEFIIQEFIDNNMKFHYKLLNENVYEFYKFYCEASLNKSNISNIDYIIEKYKSDDSTNKSVEYIRDFFLDIKSVVRRGNKRGLDKYDRVLDKYLNKEYFHEQIEIFLYESVEKYIGTSNVDSDS